MSTPRFDCTGLPCPEPVLATKKALDTDAPALLEVLVDNAPAAENVRRFGESRGYTVATVDAGGTYTLTLTAPEGGAVAAGPEVLPDCPIPQAASGQTAKKLVVFLTAETIGRGDDTLGGGLMKNFLATLTELGDELWRVVMVNGAVKIACAGHPCLDALLKLETMGAEVLVCGTCLDHFQLLEHKRCGQTTNMLDVVTSLQLASKVIKP